MMEQTNQLTIERAQNGYQVYLNEYRNIASPQARSLPYVFETMDNLLNFVEEQFNKEI
jgi:conjugal transfer/entry exclusion protein